MYRRMNRPEKTMSSRNVPLNEQLDVADEQQLVLLLDEFEADFAAGK